MKSTLFTSAGRLVCRMAHYCSCVWRRAATPVHLADELITSAQCVTRKSLHPRVGKTWYTKIRKGKRLHNCCTYFLKKKILLILIIYKLQELQNRMWWFANHWIKKNHFLKVECYPIVIWFRISDALLFCLCSKTWQIFFMGLFSIEKILLE